MVRNVRILILCFPLLAAGTLSVQAQDATPVTKLETVAEGELRLDGKITAITGASEWSMQAVSFTSPRGVTKEFDDPKSKTITVTAETKIHPRGQDDAVAFRDVKLGTPIAVIGKNGPENSIIAREVILLDGYGRGKSIGVITVNGETHRLLGQGRAALDAGQYQRAISLFGQAASAAQGLGDVRGETLSLRDQGRAYMQAELPAKAKEAYTLAAQQSRRSGHSEDEAAAYNGLGIILLRERANAEAAKVLEQADQVGQSADPRMRAIIMSNLTEAYMTLDRTADAINVLRRLAPLEEATGQATEATGSLVTIAYLTASIDSNSAKEALAKAEPRVALVKDPAERAGLLAQVGATKWLTGDEAAGRTDITTAIQMLTATGKTEAAEHWKARLKKLEDAKQAPAAEQ